MNKWSQKLKLAGLRATTQRMALMEALFGDGQDRHVTADDVYAMMRERGVKISLATVYNTLNSLTHAGLLHQVSFDAGRVWFDTNINAHFHLYDEDMDELTDIPASALPDFVIPHDKRNKPVRRVDLVIRVSENWPNA